MFPPGQSGGAPIKSYAEALPAGHDTGWHDHARAQLVYALSGTLRVETVDGTWIVPPNLAVWVPAGRHHRLVMHGAVELRTLYLRAGAWSGGGETCRVLRVSELLRALVLKCCEAPPARRSVVTHRLAVLLDELSAAPAADLHLAPGRDRRLRRVTDALLAAPAEGRSLAAWGKTVGASERTLARLFRAETGLSFADWRQRARLLRALQLLAERRDITGIALDLGYAGPSAFIQAFRRAFGVTPGRWRG